MHDLPFIDAHVHLWDLARLRYGWLTPPFTGDGPNGDVSPIAATYLPADFAREAAGWNVVGYVHVEAGAEPGQAADETAWLETLDGGPGGIVAHVPLDAPDVAARLAAQAAHPRVRGVRQIVCWHREPRRSYMPRDMTGDEAWHRGFGLLARHGLSFDCQAYPGQFASLARLFERHPAIPVIVNHTGLGVDGETDWGGGMAAFAALPHVSVKLSGLGFVWRPIDRAAAIDRVRKTIDLFGTDRVMIASDFPTDRLFANFDDTLGLLADATADLSPPERRAAWAGNANRIYRLGLDLQGDPA